MSGDAIIYHNPRCSKSRQTLQLLEENKIETSIVKYLDTPPDFETLSNILTMLNIDDPRDLMRTHEKEYTENNLSDSALTRDELIQAMIDNPKLIERPIVINGNKAAVGRPPESVLTIL